MTASVISEIDPKNPARVGYRITGPSFAAVQREIDKITSASHIARADFLNPVNDGEGEPGHEYITFGQTFARQQEFA